MNKRDKKILALVIEEYTNSAVPVGSKILTEKYKLDLSPATIRTVMSKLEREKYLYQPHISSGRIPTDKAYRFFVEKIMGEQELSLADQKKLQAEVLKLKAQNKRISRTTAKLLSSFSGSLAISGSEKEFFDFGMSELLENPEFKNSDEFCKIADVMDYIDENIDVLLKSVKEGETRIFIGKENPLKQLPNCSMLVSPYKTKSGEKAVLALIGPKRMKYAKNKSLIDYMKKLLSGSSVIVIVAGGMQAVF